MSSLTVVRNPFFLRIPSEIISRSLRQQHFTFFSRRFQNSCRTPFKILGIETSCDDTGVAIVDSERNLLGDAIHNQSQIHIENGGIIPPVAGFYHRANMEEVANEAFRIAGLSMNEIDAVAATVKPGLSLSLEVGAKYGCFLSKKWQKPFIPIHHMEAHALTARMVDQNVQFPFLVLLISGGHCLLALVENVSSFLLLGKSLDIAPGDVLDKLDRRLKLHNIAEFKTLSGGQAVEVMASRATNPSPFYFEPVNKPDCDFNFSGLSTKFDRVISQEEEKFGTAADGVVESAADVCFAVQWSIARYLCRKVERGMIFLKRKNLISPNNCSLVVSGGVAANKFIRRALQLVCDDHNYRLSIPPASLCNDNGVMIAWNGVERYREKVGVLSWNEVGSVKVSTKSPLGKDIRQSVIEEGISGLKYTKLDSLKL